LIDPRSPLLKNHALVGAKKGYWAFFLTGDIRVIYTYKDSQTIVFTDIGSHNQVY
jgi:addiction module RelE/StbE family toxin